MKHRCDRWVLSETWHLAGSHLAVERDALGAAIVIDTRRMDIRVAGPFSRVAQAQAAAERLLEMRAAEFGRLQQEGEGV